MTLSPANLKAVASYWVSKGGVNLGIVGDTAHQQKGTSYHLGQSSLKGGAYSAVTARDKAGLSEYASAIDLGKLSNSFSKLRDFSDWLVKECRRNAADTRDIREVIWFSRASNTVMRWDRERGVASEPRKGEASDSHITHTHVSYYRDSRARPQTATYQRYFDPAVPDSPGVRISKGATVRSYTMGPERPQGGLRCIASWTDAKWPGGTQVFPSSRQVHRVTCDGTSGAYTVLPKSGPYKGRNIRVGSKGVRVA